MSMSASGEEDVLQYKHNTKKKTKKKTHSAHVARALLSFLPRQPLLSQRQRHVLIYNN